MARRLRGGTAGRDAGGVRDRRRGGDRARRGVALAIDRPGRTVELGYAIAPSARGRGVATEALRQLTAWALSELDVLRIELRINVDNEASKRVAERCGFVREGVLRSMPLKAGVWGDLEVWSRLATDP